MFSQTEMSSCLLSVHSAPFPEKGQCSPSLRADFFNFGVLLSSSKDFFEKSAILLCLKLLELHFSTPKMSSF